MSAKIDYNELIQADKIHGSVYTSDEIYEDELEKLFYSSWVFIGFSHAGSKCSNRVDVVMVMVMR